MAMMDTSSWNGQDATMHPTPEDDFQQFLDMGGMATVPDGLTFDFTDFQGSNGANLMSAPLREHLDTPMTGAEVPVLLTRSDPSLQHQMPMVNNVSYRAIPTSMVPSQPPNESIIDTIDSQIQLLQQQKLQHQQRQLEEQQAAFFAAQQSRIVPPTPQSLELPPGQAHNSFYTPTSQADHTPQHNLDYRYQRLKDQQDMSFTPLVSPAVTPLETHFSVDTQFTVPGAYFSPLTSPALHAQTDPLTLFEQRHGQINTASPDMNIEGIAGSLPNSGHVEMAKKPRKSAAKTRSKAGVRQSPISKPQRRKTTTTPNLTAQVLSELVEGAEAVHSMHAHPAQAIAPASTSSTAGATDSENGSVSPEALNDSASTEMPPPPIPKPRSARPSPYIAPQSNNNPSNHPTRPQVPSPATPASLMRLSSPKGQNGGRAGSQEPIDTEHIESFELPESANFSKRNLAPIITQSPMQSPSGPTPNSSKAGNFQPLPSPVLPKPGSTASATQSPQLTPGGSSIRKTPQLMPRGSKKRSSVSTVHHSPALRPKISPSIKPLLPGGADAEESASHLLATKSNYQRILDGNTLPGVSYPSELSTNLTSKRTSHKIAEQGRRNRINSALLEIATLLPRPPPKEGKGSDGEGSDKKDKSGNTPNSKASTVEMAIEYIKQLKQEVEEANRRAEEAEKKLGMQQESE